MKKKKLRLDELKVKSFVTQDDEALGKTIKAGFNDIIDTPNEPQTIDPFETQVDCDPTPATWCFYCPVDF